MALASGLPIEQVRDRRVGAEHAAEQRVVDAAVEVDEAADAEFLLVGEAARGLAGDGARGLSAPLAKRRLPQASYDRRSNTLPLWSVMTEIEPR